MEDDSKYSGWVVAVILGIILIFVWGSASGKQEIETQLTEAEDEISSLESKVEDYQSALSEANDTIDALNYDIEEAQSWSGGDYYDMIDALDNMSTRDTISEP
jgi:peptidoglycan hydrolase CwlO-like protein